MNNYTIIIPFRCQTEDRKRNLLYVIEYYHKYLKGCDIILVEQDTITDLGNCSSRVFKHIHYVSDTELFLKTTLLNLGFNNRKTDYIVLADADCIPDSNILLNIKSIEEELKIKYVVPYQECYYLTQEKTIKFIEDKQLNESLNDYLLPINVFHTTGGVGIINADNYKKIGGHDERYRGWGGEDCSFYNKCVITIGIHRIKGDLIHLFHSDGPVFVGSSYIDNCNNMLSPSPMNTNLI